MRSEGTSHEANDRAEVPSRVVGSGIAADNAPFPFREGWAVAAVGVGRVPGAAIPEAGFGRRTDRSGRPYKSKAARAEQLRKNATPAEKRFWTMV